MKYKKLDKKSFEQDAFQVIDSLLDNLEYLINTLDTHIDNRHITNMSSEDFEVQSRVTCGYIHNEDQSLYRAIKKKMARERYLDEEALFLDAL